MSEPPQGEGNGGTGRGLIDAVDVIAGCTLFHANPQRPPPLDEMPKALSQALAKWMRSTGARVRATLPIIEKGDLRAVWVWWDPAATPPSHHPR